LFSGVCAVDVDLDGPMGMSKALSQVHICCLPGSFLYLLSRKVRIGVGNGVAFVCNVDGFFVASTSTALVATNLVTRQPLLVTEINSTLINNTLNALLAMHGKIPDIPEINNLYLVRVCLVLLFFALTFASQVH
jgi:hypothetical protein